MRRTTVGVWWLRVATPDGVTAHGFAGDAYPDGTVVPALPPGRGAPGVRLARARTLAATQQLTEVVVGEGVAPKAPLLVLAEVVDREASPVSVALLAFLHDDAVAGARAAQVPPPRPGAVLTGRDLRRIGLAGDRQVGAVRWLPATGRVAELYVDPAYRRRRIATTLLLSAEATAIARGWPSLRVDGVRTELGEALRRGLRWGAQRWAPWVRVAPPMTPAGEEAGRLVVR